MSVGNEWWIIGLLLILMGVSLLGPGASAWARPHQFAQTIPTPTPPGGQVFLPFISVAGTIPSATPPQNRIFLPLIIRN
jgi:hypothetical protein